jgi:hypothetical protein
VILDTSVELQYRMGMFPATEPQNPSSQRCYEKGLLGVTDEKYIVGDIFLICTLNLVHFTVFNNPENIRKGKEFYGSSMVNETQTNETPPRRGRICLD